MCCSKDLEGEEFEENEWQRFLWSIQQKRTPAIPQVDTAGMPDEEKAKIPPMNRLESEPTEAEKKLFSLMLRGLDDPEYWKAMKAVDKERDEKV